jgi:hypothetical protein
MKCPHCGKSLWFVKDWCPFCKAPIPSEASLPATAPDPPGPAPAMARKAGNVGKWITLTKCPTLAEADALVAQLEAAGIAAHLPDEFGAQSAPFHAFSQGFVRVEVLSFQVDTARQLLARPAEAISDEAKVALAGQEKLASIPLPWGMRCVAAALPLLCVCGPGLVALVLIIQRYAKQGYDRKVAHMWLYFFIGCLLCAVAGYVLASRG